MEWRGVFGMFLYIVSRKVGVRSRQPNTEMLSKFHTLLRAVKLLVETFVSVVAFHFDASRDATR